MCSRSRDRLDGDASAHSALAGIYGRRGVVLFNPRLNLSMHPCVKVLGQKLLPKNIYMINILLIEVLIYSNKIME